jgi:hypothetical protein
MAREPAAAATGVSGRCGPASSTTAADSPPPSGDRRDPADVDVPAGSGRLDLPHRAIAPQSRR